MLDSGTGQLVDGLGEPGDSRGLLFSGHLPPLFNLQALDLGRRILAERVRPHGGIIAVPIDEILTRATSGRDTCPDDRAVTQRR